ncbi:VWA domain-containing protein [Methylomonas methanica]|uniref:Tetratricopeptide TPR_1 repeat-containing protein n=1 Tax=Methylomonas methanica (strain DSM 25384 / MC09) TaxID=857087 RepID=F9ZXX9_METMM|nr:VWA domain-containing protein [Methylomonas methanica]AEF98558.1 Tetratricopeptide TPR_1 repeat-containing protein [Methylomonas methanica MC09]
MWATFHFLRPWWLLSIIPAAVLLYLSVQHKYRRGDWTTVCDAELLPFILQDKPDRVHPGGWIGAALACLLCILALAGPTWERIPSPAFRNDSALVIALDLSKSMNATDIKPSRISRARYKISDILKQRKDGQTALLVYSGDAFTVTPLTTDTATINSQIEALTTDIMPSSGSNTGVAIEKATDLLHQAGLAQGDILLVTDGADADSIHQAKRLLGDYRLSVLAMGTPEGAPIPVPGGFLKDSQGNIVVARLDSAELSQLASTGHGIYQPVTADDSDVDRLGSLFSQVKSNDSAEKTNLLLEQWKEVGPWLLLLVLPWAALRFRKGLLTLGLLCLLPLPKPAAALDWQSLWHTQDQRAQQAFQQQQYQQAAEQFSNPDWRAAAQYKAGQFQEAAETLKDTQSADGHYNRGNALAKAGQLQEAIQAYQAALKLDPNHADARYNKELLEKQLQDQQKQQNQDKQSSDQSSEKNQQDQQKGQSESQKQDENKDQSQQQKQEQEQNQDKPQPGEDGPANKPEQNQDKRPQPDQQADQPDDARREPKNPKPEQSPKNQPAAQPASEQDEAKRANEQLLKRIPDEPTGLLKRKFKYQYGQRDPPPHSGPDW